jgi:hypothetical protein
MRRRSESVEVAMVHSGLTIYRVIGAEPRVRWSFTTCSECATRADGLLPHAFDVRGLPNPSRLDLETRDEAALAFSICEILRRNADSGAIVTTRCDSRRYMLDFVVPCDTPGSYIRATFALHGLPRAAAEAFLADLSLGIALGRHDLLVSEQRLIENALEAAFAVPGCDRSCRQALAAELSGLLPGR